MEKTGVQVDCVATECQGVVQVGTRQAHIVVNVSGSFFNVFGGAVLVP